MNQGPCTPGATQECGSGGVQTCTATCQWGTCGGQTCSGLASQACGNCGVPVGRVHGGDAAPHGDGGGA
jgi:hypothetical protein